MRRSATMVVALLFSMALALVLAACGTGEAEEGTTGPVAEGATTSAAAEPAPTTSGPTTTAPTTAPTTSVASETKTIVGSWTTADGVFQVFKEDGTFTVGDAPKAPPFDRSTYTLDGDLPTQITADSSEGCVEPTTDDDGNEVMKGGTGVYRIVLSEDGDSLTLEKIEDDCYFRSKDYARGLTRYGSD